MTGFGGCLSGVVLALLACAQLPEIGARQCGNGVIEPPEDCDTFGHDAGASCRPAGSVGECHFDCSQGRALCPEGWGCDAAGICRRPTGGFEQPRELEVGSASRVESGDFDGDGRADVLSTEPADPLGLTRIRFHYFDQQASLDETRAFPHRLLSPALVQMNGDALADVVFSDGRVGMLLGRADRSWVPETFSSYRIPGTAIRTLAVSDGPVQQTTGFVVFAVFEQQAGVYVPDVSNRGLPRLLGTLPGPIEALVGDPAGGQLIEGAPCRQGVVAQRGDAELSVLDVCELGPDGSPVFRQQMATQTIALEPPEPIAFAPLVADINADGHLDVIVGSAERAFVSQGDGQTFAPAVPYELPLGDAGRQAMPMPLAAGDVTGDGAVDFVFEDHLVLSTGSGSGAYTTFANATTRWTSAVIADLNANGHADVVGASNERPGITFYNGTGTPDLTVFSLSTSRPVQRLNVGDFDGDLIQDLAFTQAVGGSASESQIMIAFGAPFGPPLPGVPVARLRNVEQITTYREAMLSHLVITSTERAENEPTGGERSGVLTLLTGSGDRVPVALYELTTFAADSSVDDSTALRVLGGSFTSAAPGDVLAVAFNDQLTDAGLRFWLLPALASSAGTPVLLEGGLPPELHPVLGAGGISLASLAADLDGNGRDEALFAMPGRDPEQCALLVLQVDPTRVLPRGTLALPEPCQRLELRAVHADADARPDLAWLTGRADGSESQLSILWNDGSGNFSADRRSVISGRSASPQAFALLPRNAARSARMVYATSLGLELVPIAGDTRELGTPEALFPLLGVTGLTPADVNGDGAVDLVAAALGNLAVLEAGLEAL